MAHVSVCFVRMSWNFIQLNISDWKKETYTLSSPPKPARQTPDKRSSSDVISIHCFSMHSVIGLGLGTNKQDSRKIFLVEFFEIWSLRNIHCGAAL